MNHIPLFLLLLTLLLSAAGNARAGAAAAKCVHIMDVTAFTPRNELYVVIEAQCDERGFESEDPILAYLEVLVTDLPPVSQDVRVYSADPKRRFTYEFHDLGIDTGDPILVRLVRFGEILSLKTIMAP